MTDTMFHHPDVLVVRARGLGSKLAAAILMLSDREQRLVARYHRLAAGGQRRTPAVPVVGRERPFDIVSPPTESNPNWILNAGFNPIGDGSAVERFEVSTEQIRDLGSCRDLGGYN